MEQPLTPFDYKLPVFIAAVANRDANGKVQIQDPACLRTAHFDAMAIFTSENLAVEFVKRHSIKKQRIVRIDRSADLIDLLHQARSKGMPGATFDPIDAGNSGTHILIDQLVE